jgi:hypothetical protein
MRHLALAALLLLGSPALGQTLWLGSGPPTLAQVLPQPKPGVPGASCPFGYTSSGAFCIPSKRASDAIPKPPTGLARGVGWRAVAIACAVDNEISKLAVGEPT